MPACALRRIAAAPPATRRSRRWPWRRPRRRRPRECPCRRTSPSSFVATAFELRLAAAVVAHQHHVLEAGLDQLFGDLLVDGLEDLVGEADRAGQVRAGAVGRERQHRRGDGVAELERDVAHLFAPEQRVAAVDVLRARAVRCRRCRRAPWSCRRRWPSSPRATSSSRIPRWACGWRRPRGDALRPATARPERARQHHHANRCLHHGSSESRRLSQGRAGKFQPNAGPPLSHTGRSRVTVQYSPTAAIASDAGTTTRR